MITFKQFLNEENTDLRTLLQKDCAPFIREANGAGVLYRGIKGLTPESAKEIDGVKYWVKTVRKDRRPSTMPLAIHNEIDEWFNKKFGLQARSQTMFCAGDPEYLEQYGSVQIVVPIGPIRYVWSPQVRDLIDVWEWANNEYDGDFEGMGIHNLGYTDKNLDSAITTRVRKSAPEIMVECDKYYVFSRDDEDIIRKALK